MKPWLIGLTAILFCGCATGYMFVKEDATLGDLREARSNCLTRVRVVSAEGNRQFVACMGNRGFIQATDIQGNRIPGVEGELIGCPGSIDYPNGKDWRWKCGNVSRHMNEYQPPNPD